MPPIYKFLSLGMLLLLAGSLAINIGMLIRSRQHPIDWKLRASRLRTLPWRFQDAATLLVLVVFAQLASVIPAVVAFDQGWINEHQRDIFAIAVLTIVFPLVGLVAFLRISSARGMHWSDLMLVDNVRLRDRCAFGTYCYVGMLFAVTILAFSNNITLEYLGYEKDHQEVVDILLGQNFPTWLKFQLVIISIVVAPIVEEIIFRGVALPVCMQRLPVIPSAFLVSLLFAAMHFHIPSIVPLFAVGFAFSLAYIYSGSLVVPITMHALFNGINILLLFVLGDVPEKFLSPP